MLKHALKPGLSYTIWFPQRVGSTAICDMLQSTKVAGNPGEWLNCAPDQSLHQLHSTSDADELQKRLWELGSIDSVFGLKYGPWQPKFDEILTTLKQFPGGADQQTPLAIWNNAFPNSRHIFLTRRDKVRLAVSWWKAIQNKEWHRRTGESANPVAVEYSFDAINDLYTQSIEREALIIETLSGSDFLTVCYEDFEQSPVDVVQAILTYVGVNEAVEIKHPNFEKLSDQQSEEWVARFKEEKARETSGQG